MKQTGDKVKMQIKGKREEKNEVKGKNKKSLQREEGSNGMPLHSFQ